MSIKSTPHHIKQEGKQDNKKGGTLRQSQGGRQWQNVSTEVS
jgi:hypothetical protein